MFRQMSCIRMLKTFNKAKFDYPAVVYEEINAVFRKEKPKNDKIVQIFLTFKHFYAIFVNVSIEMVD